MKRYTCLKCGYEAIQADVGNRGPYCPVGFYEKTIDGGSSNQHGKLHRVRVQVRSGGNGRYIREIEVGADEADGPSGEGSEPASGPEPQRGAP